MKTYDYLLSYNINLPKNSPPDCFLNGRLQIPSFSLYIKNKKHRSVSQNTDDADTRSAYDDFSQAIFDSYVHADNPHGLLFSLIYAEAAFFQKIPCL